LGRGIRGIISGAYSRVDDVSLVVESVLADPEAGPFDHGQNAGSLAGGGAAFELAEARSLGVRTGRHFGGFVWWFVYLSSFPSMEKTASLTRLAFTVVLGAGVRPDIGHSDTP
jgi:hypothetical protein